MDKQSLNKFRPIVDSPLWGRLEDDYLIPELENLRNNLERLSDPKEFSKVQGEIRFIRKLLSLKDTLRIVEEE